MYILYILCILYIIILYYTGCTCFYAVVGLRICKNKNQKKREKGKISLFHKQNEAIEFLQDFA